MSIARDRSWHVRCFLGAVLAAAILAACGGDSPDPQAPPDEPAPTIDTSSTAPPDEAVYSTSEFVVPFTVPVPEWLEGAEVTEEPRFITWAPAAEQEPAVRFLAPVVVYAPGDTAAIPTPDDFLAYLLSQAEYGATLADRTTTTLGGLTATILTASVTEPGLDGSLGCSEEGIAAPDCFGLQSELTLRIAVIDTGDRTLLAWLRHTNGTNDAQMALEFAQFEEMLASIEFEM